MLRLQLRAGARAAPPGAAGLGMGRLQPTPHPLLDETPLRNGVRKLMRASAPPHSSSSWVADVAIGSRGVSLEVPRWVSVPRLPALCGRTPDPPLLCAVPKPDGAFSSRHTGFPIKRSLAHSSPVTLAGARPSLVVVAHRCGGLTSSCRWGRPGCRAAVGVRANRTVPRPGTEMKPAGFLTPARHATGWGLQRPPPGRGPAGDMEGV